MSEQQSQGISRRDLLKKGAVLGGGVVWVTPVVQTLGMGKAFASSTSPDPDDPEISYVALIIECDDEKWYVKWEADSEEFEEDPGYGEECSHELSTYDAEPNNGELLEVSSLGDYCYLIDWADPDNTPCEDVSIEAAVVKGGQECERVPGSSFPLTVCLEVEDEVEETTETTEAETTETTEAETTETTEAETTETTEAETTETTEAETTETTEAETTETTEAETTETTEAETTETTEAETTETTRFRKKGKSPEEGT